MKRLITIILLLSSAGAARAVPVVPNFQQGSMTSHTETGWEYSVTGVGIENNGQALNPPVTTSTVTVTPGGTSAAGTNGNTITGTVTSSFDSLDFSQPNNFTIADPAAGFQFTQSYQGPGMTNQTIIQRVTTIESVTDTTSTFTQ